MSFAPEQETFAKPQALLRVPVGMASPLWGLFAGAAMTGAAWWWMTRWARPENLESMFGSAAKVEAAIAPEAAAVAAPVAEVSEVVFETTVEPVLEATAEVIPEPLVGATAELSSEPMLEALTEARETQEPVGGEAAPISPVLEALTPEIVEPTATESLEPTLMAESLVDAAAEPKPRRKANPPKAD